MKWAKEDAVSEKEVNRNNAVYNIQENRNPFIDYPGLEDYIWGDKKDEAFSYDNYNGEETGIKDSQTSNLKPHTSNLHDLQGRRVTHPTKGLYIRNGHKVLLK